MILYFVNGSQQKKKLIESDFADDIYDMLIGFFEDHGHYPRFLECKREDESIVISFESASEHFLIENVNDSDEDELMSLVGEYKR